MEKLWQAVSYIHYKQSGFLTETLDTTLLRSFSLGQPVFSCEQYHHETIQKYCNVSSSRDIGIKEDHSRLPEPQPAYDWDHFIGAFIRAKTRAHLRHRRPKNLTAQHTQTNPRMLVSNKKVPGLLKLICDSQSDISQLHNLCIYIARHQITVDLLGFSRRRKWANTLNNFLLAGDFVPASTSERLGRLSLELTMNSYVDILWQTVKKGKQNVVS